MSIGPDIDSNLDKAEAMIRKATARSMAIMGAVSRSASRTLSDLVAPVIDLHTRQRAFGNA